MRKIALVYIVSDFNHAREIVRTCLPGPPREALKTVPLLRYDDKVEPGVTLRCAPTQVANGPSDAIDAYYCPQVGNPPTQFLYLIATHAP